MPTYSNVYAKTLLSVFALSLGGCAAGPEALLRSHTYSGPTKSRDEVAAVFTALHPVHQAYHTLICEVDGTSYRRLGLISNCPSVVYLLPGKHKLVLETRYANLMGNNYYELDVEAGRHYQVITTTVARDRVAFSTRQMPKGTVLTYQDIAPVFFEGKSRPNAAVPFEAN